MEKHKSPPTLTHQACPFVSCGADGCFSYWGESGSGHCHSCGRNYPSSNEVFDWATESYPTRERIDMKNAEIVGYSCSGIRGLDEDVARLFGIQIQYAQDTAGNKVPVRYAFKYNDNVKYRGYDEKKFWLKQNGSLSDLFGPEFNAGSSKRLYITEGEFDAASLFQVLGKSYPVKSLPSASWSDKFIKKNFEYINSFKEVVYAGELDAAGSQSAERLYAMFPDKFYFVSMTKWKDANEFLVNGDSETLKWAALKPQRYTPDNFYVGEEAIENAIKNENPYQYTPTGHVKLDEKIRGLVRGGIMFVKAPRGSGKTELIRYFEIGLLRNCSESKIGLLHMEEMKSTTYRAMATYELGVNVRTKEDAKENGIDESKVIEAAKQVADGDRTVVFEMREHDSPLQLLEHVRLGATVYGVTHFFIDHVQRLAYLSSEGADGATSLLTALGSRMAQLAKELNIAVIFISQVNDDGRTKYASALEEEAIICLKIERDTEAESEKERNTTHFIVDKNRPFSQLGDAGCVYYDPETTILDEVVLDV